MKPKHLFWGLLFLTTGIFILLNNLGLLHIDFSGFWRYWPLVLIILGVSFLIGNNVVRSLLAGASGIILAVVLFSIFTSTFDFVDNGIVINDNGINVDFDNSNIDTSYYSEPFSPDLKNAEMILEAGAGKFKISDITDKLFEAKTQGYKNNYDLSKTIDNGKAQIDLKMRDRKIILNSKHNMNNVKLSFNTKPAWDMRFKVGAAKMDFDLTPYITDNISVDMGAASMRMKLGSRSDVTKLNIEAGVSSITIDVPDSSGCQINTDVSLSSKHFENFRSTGNGVYVTNNFDSAKKKIYINIKTGISSITVNRYSGGW